MRPCLGLAPRACPSGLPPRACPLGLGPPGLLAALPEEHREAVPSAEAPGELARGLHSFQAAVFAQEETLEAGGSASVRGPAGEARGSA